jgi:hypothetical protein
MRSSSHPFIRTPRQTDSNQVAFLSPSVYYQLRTHPLSQLVSGSPTAPGLS